jgi:sn-glycerol 3-phosphate transport system permease protein
VIAGRRSSFAVGLGALAAVAWLLPYAWMVLTSLRSVREIVEHPTRPFPDHFGATTFDAYREVFAAIPVGRYLGVTVAMAVAIAASQIALALPAGYALAKLRFAGRRVAFGAVVACLLVPSQAIFVPVFSMLAHVRLVNTMTALVLPFAASAFGTFLVRQALLGVPDEIIEAARMDGAGEWTLVYRILAPIVRPTLVSLFLVSFVFHFSDYFWPLVMTTDDSVRTLPLGVALLREQGTGVRWNVVMAGNVVLSLPVLALFVATQRHLVRGVRGGG